MRTRGEDGQLQAKGGDSGERTPADTFISGFWSPFLLIRLPPHLPWQPQETNKPPMLSRLPDSLRASEHHVERLSLP